MRLSRSALQPPRLGGVLPRRLALPHRRRRGMGDEHRRRRVRDDRRRDPSRLRVSLGSTWPEIWLVDGCTPSSYWPNRDPTTVGSRRSATRAATMFTVTPGERAEERAPTGDGAAPRSRFAALPARSSRPQRVTSRGRTIHILRQDAGRSPGSDRRTAAGPVHRDHTPGSPGIAGQPRRETSGRTVRVESRTGGNGCSPTTSPAFADRRLTFFEQGQTSYRGSARWPAGEARSSRLGLLAHAGFARSSPASRAPAFPPRPRRRAPPARPTSPTRPAGCRGTPTHRLEVRRHVMGLASGVWQRTASSLYAPATGHATCRLRVPRTDGLPPAGGPADAVGPVSASAPSAPPGALGPATRVRFAATKRTPSPFRPYADLGRRRGRSLKVGRPWP